jgi:hypothetical protein
VVDVAVVAVVVGGGGVLVAVVMVVAVVLGFIFFFPRTIGIIIIALKMITQTNKNEINLLLQRRPHLK